MIAEASGWSFFAFPVIAIVLVVILRALGPAIRPLVVGLALIGAAVGVIAAGIALCAFLFAVVARWAGWTGPWQGNGPAAPLTLAILAIAIAILPLIGAALYARARWRRKVD